MNIDLEGIPFTQVSNIVLNDKSLSWKAKGIFAYIYSKPNGWEYSTDRMQHDALDGLDSLYTGIKELENKGYLLRKRLASGKVKYSLSVKPRLGNSQAGKNGGISNTERLSNKEKKVTVASPTDIAPDTKKKTDQNEPLGDIGSVVSYLDSSKSRHIGILALYVDYRRKSLAPKLKTKGQLAALIKRHSRAASQLSVYDDQQLQRAFAEVEKKNKDIDWTLETVQKYLTK